MCGVNTPESLYHAHHRYPERDGNVQRLLDSILRNLDGEVGQCNGLVAYAGHLVTDNERQRKLIAPQILHAGGLVGDLECGDRVSFSFQSANEWGSFARRLPRNFFFGAKRGFSDFGMIRQRGVPRDDYTINERRVAGPKDSTDVVGRSDVLDNYGDRMPRRDRGRPRNSINLSTLQFSHSVRR